MAAVADDDRRSHLAAGQVGERNREQDDFTLEKLIENVVVGVLPGGGQSVLR